MVGLIAGIFTVGIMREGNAECDKGVERAERPRRLDQSKVAVHGTGGDVVLRHIRRTVAFADGCGLLVVGLLVRAGVAGGSHEPSLGEDGRIAVHPVRGQSGIVGGSPASDDGDAAGIHGDAGVVDDEGIIRFQDCRPPVRVSERSAERDF